MFRRVHISKNDVSNFSAESSLHFTQVFQISNVLEKNPTGISLDPLQSRRIHQKCSSCLQKWGGASNKVIINFHFFIEY